METRLQHSLRALAWLGWEGGGESWAGVWMERCQDHTVRFGSTAKVLAECKLKYYRISGVDPQHNCNGGKVRYILVRAECNAQLMGDCLRDNDHWVCMAGVPGDAGGAAECPGSAVGHGAAERAPGERVRAEEAGAQGSAGDRPRQCSAVGGEQCICVHGHSIPPPPPHS